MGSSRFYVLVFITAAGLMPAVSRADFLAKHQSSEPSALSVGEPPGHPTKANVIAPETANLGKELFFPTAELGNFTERYTKEDFGTGKNFPQALAGHDEYSAALAVYDMMRPISSGAWSLGYDKVQSVLKQFSDKPASEGQFEGFAKRLEVAFDNWGDDPDKKIPNDVAPTDQKLKPFYEAFKKVKAEKEVESQQLASILKRAAGKDGDGLESEKNKLYNNPKFAVGPKVLSWLSKLVREGDGAKAKEWVQALGHVSGDKIVLTANYKGKPFNLVLDKQDDKALFAALQDPVIRDSSFVGTKHKAEAYAEDWVFRNGQLTFQETPSEAYAAIGSARAAAVGLRSGNKGQAVVFQKH